MNASRTLLNTLVQGSTVDLFHSRGIALAPLPAVQLTPGQPRYFGLAGIVAFTAPKLNGSVALSLAEGIYGLFSPQVVGPAAISDLLRELTNQLAGRVKNRLLQFQVALSVGVPSITHGHGAERHQAQSDPDTLYVFRTRRGEVRVVLSAAVDDGLLEYSNAVSVAKEGEFVPF